MMADNISLDQIRIIMTWNHPMHHLNYEHKNGVYYESNAFSKINGVFGYMSCFSYKLPRFVIKLGIFP